MKKTILFIVVLLSSLLAKTQQMPASQAYSFIENKGQIADENGKPASNILFVTQIGGAKVFLAKNGLHYQWERHINPPTANIKHDFETYTKQLQESRLETYRLDIELVGANPNPAVEKFDVADDYVNYYLGHCPQGVLGVKHYAKVVYKNVYPGIDWVWYNKNGQVKYDFVVHQGADYKQIKLKVAGAESIKIAENGGLEITTPFGKVNEKAPVSFQSGKPVSSMFNLNNDVVSFHMAGLNPAEDLVIDPVILLWSTYYGGEGDDIAMAVKTGLANNNVYITGSTQSSINIFYAGFLNKTSNAFATDAFLAKFDENGKRIWATYYGSNALDAAFDLDIDTMDNIYVAGYTNSADSIAFKGHQNSNAGAHDAFLVKFAKDGTRNWATFYGGANSDDGFGVCADLYDVYLVGQTNSISGIATTGSYKGNDDVFVAHFDTSGKRLSAIYYGGTGSELPKDIHMDKTGNIYITGQTYSTSSIYSNGHQSGNNGSGDAFLAKFNPSLTLLWGTYYGGTKLEYGTGVTTDASGNVYLVGQTSSSSNISISTAYQNAFGGMDDAFLVKFNPSGTRVWGTYFGSDSSDVGYAVATNLNDEIFITGKTQSIKNIAYNGYKNTIEGKSDIFVAKFGSGGNRLWATYFGDTLVDQSNSITCSQNGGIYIAGYANSIKDIAIGGHQNVAGGKLDGFLTKFYDKELTVDGLNDDIYCGTRAVQFILQKPMQIAKARWYHDTTGTWFYEGDTLSAQLTKTDTMWVRWYSPNYSGPFTRVITTILLAPSADYAVNDSTQCAISNSFVFTNNTDTKGGNVTYLWSFGDFTTSANATPLAHNYINYGYYNVRLDATMTSTNCKSSKSKLMRVFELPAAQQITGPTTAKNGQTVNYSAISRPQSTYNWTISGGTQTAGANTANISIQWGSGTSGKVTIEEVDSNGCTSFPVAQTVSLQPSAINTVSEPFISVYPNPANTVFFIYPAYAGMYTITDVTGREIIKGNAAAITEKSIDITELVAGTYILAYDVQGAPGYKAKLIVY